MVGIKVVFNGTVSQRTGVQEIELNVEPDLDKAVEVIRKFIIDKAGSDVLFNIFINGTNYSIARKKQIEVNEGDKFNIIPVVLGG